MDFFEYITFPVQFYKMGRLSHDEVFRKVIKELENPNPAPLNADKYLAHFVTPAGVSRAVEIALDTGCTVGRRYRNKAEQ